MARLDALACSEASHRPNAANCKRRLITPNRPSATRGPLYSHGKQFRRGVATGTTALPISSPEEYPGICVPGARPRRGYNPLARLIHVLGVMQQPCSHFETRPDVLLCTQESWMGGENRLWGEGSKFEHAPLGDRWGNGPQRVSVRIREREIGTWNRSTLTTHQCRPEPRQSR